MNRFYRFAIVCFIWPVLTLATDDEPVAQIRAVTEQMLSQLEHSPEIREDAQALGRMIEDTLLPYVDFTGLSRLTLGKHWKRASDQQRDAFSHEFRHLLVRSYSSVLSNYSDQQVEFLSSKRTPNAHRAIVRTRVVSANNPPVVVDYRLRQVNGQWKIYDVSIEGASLAVNYRNNFSQAIKSHGLDGLIADLISQNARGCVARKVVLSSAVQC